MSGFAPRTGVLPSPKAKCLSGRRPEDEGGPLTTWPRRRAQWPLACGQRPLLSQTTAPARQINHGAKEKQTSDGGHHVLPKLSPDTVPVATKQRTDSTIPEALKDPRNTGREMTAETRPTLPSTYYAPGVAPSTCSGSPNLSTAPGGSPVTGPHPP